MDVSSGEDSGIPMSIVSWYTRTSHAKSKNTIEFSFGHASFVSFS